MKDLLSALPGFVVSSSSSDATNEESEEMYTI